ncbi:serine/threonine-protein phosphatase 4 regulatory subunit 2-B-like isoform X2 [Xenia sp. Carnegie-2017]|uniref:serine/threonine-protein phosphatase 4 regulatory subunit 2-B-like isoform X2 n=1 Tax=Xenia sp. Carnegie-2017 TaxID=2897299 RepID=UPI001F03E3D5|nr:serine/threonine-protein phosphatase 4 regulatory subunit 2-B-like isoform X2 [Xenia sp. Carnegie-2017]
MVLEEMFENCPSLDVASNSDPTSKPKNLYPDVKRLVDIINNFTGTPFTIQRLCELLNEPKRYYKTMEKLFHGLEKNIMVVSTIKPDGTLITRSSMLTNGSSSPVTRTTSIRPAAVNNQTPLNSTSQLGVNSLDTEVSDSLRNCDNTSLSNCDIKLQENIEINQDRSCEPETCNASFSDESHSKSQSSDLSASVDVGEDVIEKENSNPLDENFNDEKSMSDERL